jgi:predicted membrane protein
MNTRRQHHPAAQIVVGLAVIAIGVLFLFDNLGWLDIDLTVQFWPVILIAAGVLKILQGREPRGKVTGAVLVVVGAVLLLKGLGIFHITWNMLAPLLMIAGGLAVVARSASRKSRQDAFGVGFKPDGDNVIQVAAILGSYRRRITSQQFAGGEITAVMAGCDLDLREASMPPGEAVLHVFTLMGGVNIQVPVDWTVQLEGIPVLGGFDETTLRPKDGTKRLIVRGHTIMGGLEIRN